MILESHPANQTQRNAFLIPALVIRWFKPTSQTISDNWIYTRGKGTQHCSLGELLRTSSSLLDEAQVQSWWSIHTSYRVLGSFHPNQSLPTMTQQALNPLATSHTFMQHLFFLVLCKTTTRPFAACFPWFSFFLLAHWKGSHENCVQGAEPHHTRSQGTLTQVWCDHTQITLAWARHLHQGHKSLCPYCSAWRMLLATLMHLTN